MYAAWKQLAVLKETSVQSIHKVNCCRALCRRRWDSEHDRKVIMKMIVFYWVGESCVASCVRSLHFTAFVFHQIWIWFLYSHETNTLVHWVHLLIIHWVNPAFLFFSLKQNIWSHVSIMAWGMGDFRVHTWTGIVGEEPSCILNVMHRQVCLCQTGPEVSAATLPNQFAQPDYFTLCVWPVNVTFKTFQSLEEVTG